MQNILLLLILNESCYFVTNTEVKISLHLLPVHVCTLCGTIYDFAAKRVTRW